MTPGAIGATVSVKQRFSVHTHHLRVTEFSGGPPEIGLESQVDGSVSPVLVTTYDPTVHDSLLDCLRDHLATGGDPWAFAVQFFRAEIEQNTAAAIRRMLSLIKGAPKPKLAVDQIAWACGLSLMEGETVGTLAKAHGISKQAFQQGARKYREAFKVRSQTERSKVAKDKMKRRNATHKKAKPVWNQGYEKLPSKCGKFRADKDYHG